MRLRFSHAVLGRLTVLLPMLAIGCELGSPTAASGKPGDGDGDRPPPNSGGDTDAGPKRHLPPNCEPQTADELAEYDKKMPRRDLTTVAYDGGVAFVSKTPSGAPIPIHQNTKTPSTAGPVDWSQYLAPAYDQGVCGTCYAHAGMEYFAALYARANNQTPVWYDVTPIPIISAAFSWIQPLKTDYATYANPSVLAGWPRAQFAVGACNTGGLFDYVVRSLLVLQRANPNKFFCQQSQDTPITSPEPNAYLIRSTDAGPALAYPLASCDAGSCVAANELPACDVGAGNTANVVPSGITVESFNSVQTDPQLTRITPAWASYALGMDRSPLVIEMSAQDAYGIMAYKKLLRQDANERVGKCSEMLIGDTLKLSDFDMGNHAICIEDGDGGAGCTVQYYQGSIDHVLLLVNAERADDDAGINLTIRNSWGATWGAGGNLEGRVQEPYACTADSDCTTHFASEMQKYGWSEFHWTMKCGLSVRAVCVAAMEEGYSPDACEPDRGTKCADPKQINAGGRCAHYFHAPDNRPRPQTYCLPSMHEAGISAMVLGTFYWQ